MVALISVVFSYPFHPFNATIVTGQSECISHNSSGQIECFDASFTSKKKKKSIRPGLSFRVSSFLSIDQRWDSPSVHLSKWLCFSLCIADAPAAAAAADADDDASDEAEDPRKQSQWTGNQNRPERKERKHLYNNHKQHWHLPSGTHPWQTCIPPSFSLSFFLYPFFPMVFTQEANAKYVNSTCDLHQPNQIHFDR